MEKLQEWSYRSIQRISLQHKRYLYHTINWKNRLNIISGARGVGKTTLLLQYLKELDSDTVLYASLDTLYFTTGSIIELAEEFVQNGGKHLFLDEVQKYPNWAIEVKNIYDNYPELTLVLSGSSAIEILQSKADLSRRTVFYKLAGLSFREYLNFTTEYYFAPISFDDLLSNHKKLSYSISQKIKPIKHFQEYSKFGYYPFYLEDKITYHHRIRQIINTVIDVDIPSVYSVDYSASQNIKKLVSIIAEIVPFKPNVKKLSEQIGISRESFIKYLKYLEKAAIINLLYNQNKGISLLNKPEKIYLNNTNIIHALNTRIDVGNLRGTFFVNQLKVQHKIRYANTADYLVDDLYTFEIGGKGKTNKQIKELDKAWVVADAMEVSIGNKIPLWLFGFLY